MNKNNDVEDIVKQITAIMLSQEISSEDALKSWIENNSSSKCVLDTLCNEDKLSLEVERFNQTELSERSIQKLKNHFSKVKRKKRIVVASYSVAAALVAVSMLVWYGETNKTIFAPNIVSHVSSMKVVTPTLVLADGQNINLNTVVDSISGVNAVKNESAKIQYSEQNRGKISPELNTLIIPSKYTYSVQLSDGTKVLLNANSKIIYPVTFDKNKREVTFEGEAFFEVAKNEIPFIIHTKGVNIKVYGTTFNINSYQRVVETTLVSGSVGITLMNHKNFVEQFLKPNQSSNINPENGVCQIKNVDASKSISWIQGDLKVDDSVLGIFINKLSCWYGVDFSFENQKIWSMPITASFKNDQELESILDAIEFSTNVKIEKREGGYHIQ